MVHSCLVDRNGSYVLLEVHPSPCQQRLLPADGDRVEELRRWWREPPAGANCRATALITGMLYIGVGLMYGSAFLCLDGLGRSRVAALAWVAVPLVVGLGTIRLRQRIPAVVDHITPVLGLGSALAFVIYADQGEQSIALAMPVLAVLLNAPFKFALREVVAQTAVTLGAAAAVLLSQGVGAGYVVFVLIVWTVVSVLTCWVARFGDAAEQDPLTGLTNRRGFERRFEAAAAAAAAARPLDPLTVAVIDVDRFKQVNDILGHHSGDQILLACAQAWAPLVPQRSLLARRGGDEFALMAVGLDEAAADDLVERLRAACPAGTTLSIGIAVLAEGESTSDLLHRADQAMYEAKRGGRDRSVRAPHPGDRHGRGPDPATGLPYFLPETDGAASSGTAAMVVEADRYHAAQDVAGLAAGEEILVDTARRLRRATAGMRAELRRLHRGRFLLLLTGHDLADLAELAERLIVPSVQAETTRHGGLTIGIALGPIGDGDTEALVRAAMTAADVAHREVPGGSVVYEPWMSAETHERAAIAAALQGVIERREIDLVFQPQVRLTDGSIVGVEVLARWTDPVRGPIPPNQFVQIAEQLGLARPLDILIFEKACAQLRAWDVAGVPVPRMSLNLSPQSVGAGQVHHGMRRLLAENHLTPYRVRIEITENEILHRVGGAAPLQQLRAMGVQVSLDDFGTGYASFSRLASLPIGELKIDRSFLPGIDTEGPQAEILASMIQLGRALDLEVVVEGVETEAHHAIVRELGCTVGQGYLYARPMSAGTLEEWIAGGGAAASLPRARTGAALRRP